MVYLGEKEAVNERGSVNLSHYVGAVDADGVLDGGVFVESWAEAKGLYQEEATALGVYPAPKVGADGAALPLGDGRRLLLVRGSKPARRKAPKAPRRRTHERVLV